MPGKWLAPYIGLVVVLSGLLGAIGLDNRQRANPSLTTTEQAIIDRTMSGQATQDGTVISNPKVRSVEPAHAVRVSVDVKPPKDKDGNQPDSQSQDLIVVFDKADKRLLTIPAPQD